MTVLRLLAALVVTAVAAPAPKTVVLTAADFPGRARDVSAHAVAPSSYVSTIAFTAPYGASRYTKLSSQALVGGGAGSANAAFAELLRLYSSAPGRAALIKRYLPGATVKSIVKPHPLGVRPVSAELGVLSSKGNLSVSLLRVDRIVMFNVAVGKGVRIVPADARAFALKEAVKASTALVPTSRTPPEVTGSPKVGQALTASRGTWGGSPTSYGVQWQMCDPSGAPCNDVAGATSSTYVVRAADVGSALRVQVTARNAFGFAFVASHATEVVS